MALTVSPNLTRVTPADNTTGWTSVKLAGAGGTPSPAQDLEIFNQGSGSVSLVVNKTTMLLYYTTAAKNFGAGGGNEGDLIYIWVLFTTVGSSQPIATGGLRIAVGDGSNFAYFNVAGSDAQVGGWKRFVIDPTLTPSSGTVNVSAITQIGVVADMGSSPSKTANLFVDAIDIGRGLQVTGTSTSMWNDILAVDDTVNNKYGIIRKDNGVLYVLGDITLGDGATLTDVSDTGQVVVWENPTYYQGGETSAIGSGVFTFDTNAGTSTLDVAMGTKVGSGDGMVGSSGCLILSAGGNLNVDFSDANANSIGLYGSTFRLLGGGMQMPTSVGHEIGGCTFDGCNQLDFGAAVVRGTFIVGHDYAVSGAILWTSITDIKYSRFLANSNGSDAYAIEFDSSVPSSVDFIGLSFSGNDADVYNNSGKSVTINVSGGGSTPTFVNGAGASTSVVNSVSVTFTNIEDNTEVRVYRTSDKVELAGIEDTLTGSFTFSEQAGTLVDIVLFNVQYDPLYLDAFSVPTQDTSIPVQQTFSRSYLNP